MCRTPTDTVRTRADFSKVAVWNTSIWRPRKWIVSHNMLRGWHTIIPHSVPTRRTVWVVMPFSLILMEVCSLWAQTHVSMLPTSLVHAAMKSSFLCGPHQVCSIWSRCSCVRMMPWAICACALLSVKREIWWITKRLICCCVKKASTLIMEKMCRKWTPCLILTCVGNKPINGTWELMVRSSIIASPQA